VAAVYKWLNSIRQGDDMISGLTMCNIAEGAEIFLECSHDCMVQEEEEKAMKASVACAPGP